jgi:hypothetical protein
MKYLVTMVKNVAKGTSKGERLFFEPSRPIEENVARRSNRPVAPESGLKIKRNRRCPKNGMS